MAAQSHKLIPLVIAAVLLLSLGGLQSAHAQNDSGQVIDTWQIEIMPEYDRPDVLVIHRISLTNTGGVPAHLSMKIPAAAGAPFNIAALGWDGALYKINYKVKQEGEWLVVDLNSVYPSVQIEYYDPRLTIQGDQRSFQYVIPFDITIRNLKVLVQQPVHASALTLSPNSAEPFTGQDGFTYYLREWGRVEAGSQFKLNIQYLKTDNVLSFSAQPVQPAEPLPDPGQAVGNGGNEFYQPLVSNGFLVIAGSVLGGFGAVFVIMALLSGYWRPKWLAAQTSTSPRRLKAGPSMHLSKPPSSLEKHFCPQCGKLAQNGDQFCRACGSRIEP